MSALLCAYLLFAPLMGVLFGYMVGWRDGKAAR